MSAPANLSLARIVAFTSDPDSSAALGAAFEGLAGATVRDGGLRAAIGAFTAGALEVDVLIVDLDDVGYAPGALQGLADVCPDDVRVVALGAGGSAREVRAVLREGVEDFLLKPLDPEDVRKFVERLWGRSGEHGELALRTVVVSGPPGVGTTAVSISLVLALERAGRFVVLLDFGAPVSVGSFVLGCVPHAGIEELVERPSRISRSSVAAIRVRRGARVGVVGRRANTWESVEVPPNTVASIANAFANEAHWVVVDVGAQYWLAQGLAGALGASLRVVEPTESGLVAAERFTRLAPAFARRASLVGSMTRAAPVLGSSRVAEATGVAPVASFGYAPAWPALAFSGIPGGKLPGAMVRDGDALVAHLEGRGTGG